MNKLTAMSVIAILASAIFLPILDSAYALEKSDTSTKLKPKAFGKKTSFSMCSEKSCHKQFKILLSSNMPDTKKLLTSQQSNSYIIIVQ